MFQDLLGMAPSRSRNASGGEHAQTGLQTGLQSLESTRVAREAREREAPRNVKPRGT